MSKILYVQTDKNMKVDKEQIILGDIAKLSCSNTKILERNQIRKVADFAPVSLY